MTSIEIICPDCLTGEPRCKTCGGIGRVWAPGAPSYGCPTRLGQTLPGEVVTLGNGDRGRVLWHMPKRSPTTTFLGLIDSFDSLESHAPIVYPSCVGVVRIEGSRSGGDSRSHAHDKARDIVDPLQRPTATLGPWRQP